MIEQKHTPYTRPWYGMKRLMLYLLFALPACLFPFFVLGVIFGALPVLISGCFLAMHDSLTVNLKQIPKVFTKGTLKWWMIEMGLILCLLFAGYFYFSQDTVTKSKMKMHITKSE